MPTELEIENCKAETYKHIQQVSNNLNIFIRELVKRGEVHDASKLESPELEGFAVALPKLKNTEYGSQEYRELLSSIKPTIEHHQSKNRHHIEFHENGIDDMDLVDLLEMVSDWRAASNRNKNGNVRKSLEKNASRYGITPQLEAILRNTIERYF